MKEDQHTADYRLLDSLLEEHGDGIEDRNPKAFEAFTEWAKKRFPLSPKQRAWLNGVAEQSGHIAAAPCENAFSSMSPEKQARQREAAKKVRLPWE